MNIVLLVVDSLRSCSLFSPRGPRTPFLERLGESSVRFRRAYATECWTLPAHCSMFTGLLPSEHGAHFQTMGYDRPHPTVAEILAGRGYFTEVATRNSIFDGSLPGITRGFRENRLILSDASPWNPCSMALALSKPRFRRQIMTTGFFGALQRQNREFVRTFARSIMPADRLVLDHVLERLGDHRRTGTPCFLFANLYDVHAPYPPAPNSIFRSAWPPRGLVENALVPLVLPTLGAHTYLRPGFRLFEAGKRMLLSRYHRAIELMDAKLAAFYDAARSRGLLDDTMLIITSDHGEAFGDHDLYLHDSSVWDTHLHVPLYVHHPERSPEVVDDVVSTRSLFDLMRAVGLREGLGGTILDAAHRSSNGVALAEHFYYPHAPQIAPHFKQNLAAAIGGSHKVMVRREGMVRFDLARDPRETSPEPTCLSEIERSLRRDGLSQASAGAFLQHVGRWSNQASSFSASPRAAS